MAALPHATPASHPQTVPDYPIDAGDGGCDCSQPTTNGRTWVSETDLITIAPQDALIDGNDGGSLYNIVAAKGIKHLLYAGVATNMCVMARHTAIVAAKTWGLEPILIRDLTDTMSAFPSATTGTHPPLLTCAPARVPAAQVQPGAAAVPRQPRRRDGAVCAVPGEAAARRGQLDWRAHGQPLRPDDA